MKTIHLKISDKVYDKLLLSKFSNEDVQVINKTDSFVSESDLLYTLNTSGVSKTNKDWFTDMTKEEQEEIKKGLEQADKDNFIANEKVMQRFNKWH